MTKKCAVLTSDWHIAVMHLEEKQFQNERFYKKSTAGIDWQARLKRSCDPNIVHAQSMFFLPRKHCYKVSIGCTKISCTKVENYRIEKYRKTLKSRKEGSIFESKENKTKIGKYVYKEKEMEN